MLVAYVTYIPYFFFFVYYCYVYNFDFAFPLWNCMYAVNMYFCWKNAYLYIITFENLIKRY